MSHTHPTAASSANTSNFQILFNNALKAYQTCTKNDLLLHPLATQLQICDSPSSILALLQEQVQGLDRSQSGDERWTKWLDPTVNVLLAFSATLGAGVGMVFSPTNVIFTGIGVLLSAAKDVRATQDTLTDVFDRIEMFFRRLEVYTEVPLTTEMMEIIIQIMVEVLCILGITTKEIKRGRIKKYIKRLIGKTDMEDALKRLDKLTQEEARMAVAQNLKATLAVDERVRGVVDTVLAIDNRVAGVDDRVAGVDDRVARVDIRVAHVDDRVKVVDKKVAEVIHGGKETDLVMQQAANDLDQIKLNDLRERIYKWLSPPDPSTNHNIACSTHHKKMATWFFQGRMYQEWKSTGSLLWIHGKPGSGKSVLCSTIIQDIKAMCKTGNASMACFYFDFRDANKQRMQDLLRSLLMQLSAAPECDILSDLYSAHDNGRNQPSDSDLAECLKDMLTLPNRRPTYLIIDALDESPNMPGIPSPREKVLQLVKELVELCIPNLHICVTSRPEIDVRKALEPLTCPQVSLHDEIGQKKDIADYVRSVVYSDSEQIIRRWRMDDKELAIKMLSERADGMFRWVFCQLEILRDCLPPSVRRTLNELPESLDETYERILKEIKKPNRDHARRLLSCLVVAVRPLRVEELAEVLAVDFDDAEELPRLNPNWRWRDEEQALLTSCSSLIVIVKSGVSRVVQFSHFSVKEFLTSARLATSSGEVLRYHIALGPAHKILAEACLSILLQLDDHVERNGIENTSPLTRYAVRHWISHAQFSNVSSSLQKAMEYLFDLDKPHFAAWRQLHDIDTVPRPGSTFFRFTPRLKSDAEPLYYAALCGFQDLVEHLILKYPQHIIANGGYYVTPLVAALAREHFRTAKVLHDNGAHLNVRGDGQATPLHSAVYYGDLHMIQLLLEYKADVNARNAIGETPLYHMTRRAWEGPNLPQVLDDVVRLLLKHGADVNAPSNQKTTPLEMAARGWRIEVVRVLLKHGADVNAPGSDRSGLLHVAARWADVGVVRVLLEQGADVNASGNDGSTPLHIAALRADIEVIRVLLEQGADVNARGNNRSTPLHIAASHMNVEVVRILLEHGASTSVNDICGNTPLRVAWYPGVIELLSEHGAK